MAARRHEALAETLLGQLVDGTFPVGSRLPTEEQLCATHGLARETVRRALRRLEDLGMITRRPGLGTTVLAARPVGDYRPMARSAADLVALSVETRLVRPETGEVVLDAEGARRLGVEEDTAWFSVRGLRVRRGRPATSVCWSEHYLRSGLEPEKLLRGRFTIEDVPEQSVDQTISAALLDARMAGALGAEPGTAALVITRRHHDEDGRIMSVGIHTHPADRYQISTTL
ncbi:GntR family transcriptional regulator [Frankia gtarii]|uniref:GntR family transcriptional regulator n=1 Tax=Frankia gtarii TaxID=2950102 RepID=UPI0021BE34E4|nr:GntR family transcriptional regulator [Frankia gtarii]